MPRDISYLDTDSHIIVVKHGLWLLNLGLLVSFTLKPPTFPDGPWSPGSSLPPVPFFISPPNGCGIPETRRL